MARLGWAGLGNNCATYRLSLTPTTQHPALWDLSDREMWTANVSVQSQSATNPSSVLFWANTVNKYGINLRRNPFCQCRAVLILASRCGNSGHKLHCSKDPASTLLHYSGTILIHMRHFSSINCVHDIELLPRPTWTADLYPKDDEWGPTLMASPSQCQYLRNSV